ncbi:hypothetical protein SDC9_205381 [bioreactor metagenome]|uniref:Uncharacterized protein n=1 Tax=bioreactor metagenome TaxID=1076179 RepID=A0A645J2Q0_9ZZZZ
MFGVECGFGCAVVVLFLEFGIGLLEQSAGILVTGAESKRHYQHSRDKRGFQQSQHFYVIPLELS